MYRFIYGAGSMLAFEMMRPYMRWATKEIVHLLPHAVQIDVNGGCLPNKMREISFR
jgi:hypothetical protein